MILKFLFAQFLVALRNQVLCDKLDLCLSDAQLQSLLNLTSLQSDVCRPFFSSRLRAKKKTFSSAHSVVECALTIFGRSRYMS